MIKLSEDEQAGYDILAPHMPADLAIDIIKHRRAKKARLTARVAKMLLNEYSAYGNIEKAAEIHLMRAWTGFQADWAKNSTAGRFTDTNNPTAKAETREEYLRRAIEQNKRSWEAPTDAVMADSVKRLVRGSLQ